MTSNDMYACPLPNCVTHPYLPSWSDITKCIIEREEDRQTERERDFVRNSGIILKATR